MMLSFLARIMMMMMNWMMNSLDMNSRPSPASRGLGTTALAIIMIGITLSRKKARLRRSQERSGCRGPFLRLRLLRVPINVRLFVNACVRACVRVPWRACVRASCVRTCACVHVYVCAARSRPSTRRTPAAPRASTRPSTSRSPVRPRTMDTRKIGEY
jgi:hypothetical protein